MNSNESMGSATETHQFETSGRFGPTDPDCQHAEETNVGEQHDWEETVSAYRVTKVFRCNACSSERVEATNEEVQA